MTFMDFCAAHGIQLRSMPPVGRWIRVPTDDKPRKRNGAVKFMGDHGFVQNWATQTEPSVWQMDKEKAPHIDFDEVRRAQAKADAQRRQRAEKATQRAEWILSQCELLTHPYFESKGFPDHQVNVWNEKAVIPMRYGSKIVGCQIIDSSGDKKFLAGQASGGAEFVMDSRGVHVVCEGYATGLSVQTALANLKTRATIHVCFSAGNMVRIAKGLPRGLVIADNDASGTGERVAREIGWPYWMSDVEGEDFNDAHQRLGTFRMAMQIREVMR